MFVSRRGANSLVSFTVLAGRLNLAYTADTEDLFNKQVSLEQFFNFIPIDIGRWIILCHEGCSVHLQVLSSIPGPHPLEDSGTPLLSIPQGCDNQKCL